MIRTLRLLLFAASVSLWGQQSNPAAPSGKNMTVLAAGTNVRQVMQSFTQALGVQCAYCHVAGDFSSDANPRKETARKMIAMVRQIDASFLSSQGVYPEGYHEVDCSTCHRGSAKPPITAPEAFFNLEEATGPPVQRPSTLGTNLKVLPADAKVHGDGSIMHEFRDALGVDCGYCHGGSGTLASDANPRKDTARDMVRLVRKINANFAGTGPYPSGTQVVTCYTCHRGEPHPASLSNKRYAMPAKAS